MAKGGAYNTAGQKQLTAHASSAVIVPFGRPGNAKGAWPHREQCATRWYSKYRSDCFVIRCVCVCMKHLRLHHDRPTGPSICDTAFNVACRRFWSESAWRLFLLPAAGGFPEARQHKSCAAGTGALERRPAVYEFAITSRRSSKRYGSSAHRKRTQNMALTMKRCMLGAVKQICSASTGSKSMWERPTTCGGAITSSTRCTFTVQPVHLQPW